MDKFLKLKKQVIDAVLSGSRGPDATVRIEILERIFQNAVIDSSCITLHDDIIDAVEEWQNELKSTDFSKTTMKVKRLIFINRIRHHRRRINKILHGEFYDRPIAETLLFYLRGNRKGLIGVYFDIEEIETARIYDRPKEMTNNSSELIDLFQRINPKNKFYKEIFQFPFDKNAHLHQMKVRFLNDSQRIPKYLIGHKEKFFIQLSKSQERYEEYLAPWTTYCIYKILRDIEIEGFELVFKRTNYYNFLASQEDYAKNRDQYSNEIKDQPIDRISHSFSVTALVIVEDYGYKKAVFMKRSNNPRLGTGKNLVGLPLCFSPIRDPTEDEIKDMNKIGIKIPSNLIVKENTDNYLFEVFKKGAFAELGIDLKPANLKVLGFGLDTNRYLYNLIGEVKLKISYEALNTKMKSAIYSHQRSSCHPVEFSPEPLIEFLAKMDENECCPTTQFTAILALCKEFGVDVVKRSMMKQVKMLT